MYDHLRIRSNARSDLAGWSIASACLIRAYWKLHSKTLSVLYRNHGPNLGSGRDMLRPDLLNVRCWVLY